MIKKLFIVSAALLVIVLIFLGIYNFSFKRSSPIVEKPSSGKTGESGLFNFAKKNTKGMIFSVTDKKIMGPILNAEKDKIIYFAASDGSVLGNSIDDMERERILDENNIENLADVIWSPSKDRAIIKSKKGDISTFYLYDYESGSTSEIKKEIDNIAWIDLGNKIIYKHFDSKTKKRTLNTADPDGSNWKNLADIEYKNISIASIPSTISISFWNRPNAFEETSLKTVSSAGGDPKEIYSGKFGADYKWSPDGEKVLISSTETRGGSKISLGVANKNGGEYKNLGLPTLVSKCVWADSSKVIYCALPGNIPENSVMPNEYNEGKIATADTFWKIEIKTGKKKRVVTLDEMKRVDKNFDAADLVLLPRENFLFFLDKSSGRLYGITLED